ncbi:hypothetical protein NO2_0493 [Candidatus Termititenax persephonae]|uniref:Uncharacterized protein n=1 Tax=Candidatus Termititenax persephonae TaxID=2218525 RepID=A0A388TGE8_9BACT|nr:hypothetical protein NO2_0493 [Candidatus Termititenax persephonae]
MNKHVQSSLKTLKQEYFNAYRNFNKKYTEYIKAEKEDQICNSRKEKQKLLTVKNRIGYEFYYEAWEKLYTSWLMYGEELSEKRNLIERLKLADCEYKVDLTQYHLTTRLFDKTYFETRLKNDLDKKASILSSLQYYNQKMHLNIVTFTLIVNAIAMCFNVYFNLKR